MAVTTKAALADELGITRARVSQYVKAGMPVRSDGKLDRDAALNWVVKYQASQTLEDKGANRARRLTGERRTASVKKYDHDAVVEMARVLVGEVGRIAARAAVKAGASLNVAHFLDTVVAIDLNDVASRIMARHDPHGPWGDGFGVLELVGTDEFEPDWHALAKEAGERFDEPACDAFLARIMFPPGWQPPPGSPAARAKAIRNGQ